MHPTSEKLSSNPVLERISVIVVYYYYYYHCGVLTTCSTDPLGHLFLRPKARDQ